MDCLYLDEVERKHHWNGTEMEPSGEKKTGKTKAVTKTDCFEIDLGLEDLGTKLNTWPTTEYGGKLG